MQRNPYNRDNVIAPLLLLSVVTVTLPNALMASGQNGRVVASLLCGTSPSRQRLISTASAEQKRHIVTISMTQAGDRAAVSSFEHVTNFHWQFCFRTASSDAPSPAGRLYGPPGFGIVRENTETTSCKCWLVRVARIMTMYAHRL